MTFSKAKLPVHADWVTDLLPIIIDFSILSTRVAFIRWPWKLPAWMWYFSSQASQEIRVQPCRSPAKCLSLLLEMGEHTVISCLCWISKAVPIFALFPNNISNYRVPTYERLLAHECSQSAFLNEISFCSHDGKYYLLENQFTLFVTVFHCEVGIDYAPNNSLELE